MMRSHRLQVFYAGFFGLVLGATLSLAGLTDFAEIHRLFLLDNLRLILVFAGAIGLSMLGFRLLGRRASIISKPFTNGTIPGSVLFGAGWALTGACPSIALVQLGEGKLVVLATILGILAGVWLYRRGLPRRLQIDAGICGEE